MSRISIITTTYNHQDFIDYTIQSILNQTFSDWELLIGDDSPGDETWNIIEWYVAKYPNKIKARHHTLNKWIVDNMNFLINQASKDSEYIAFLEWDDIRDKEYLKEKLTIFAKYPEVKLVYNNFNFIDKNNIIIQKDIFGFRKIKTYQNQKITPDAFVLANVWPIICFSANMVHKSMTEKYKLVSLEPDNKRYGAWDYDFILQVSSHYPIYYTPKSLTLYRRHENNLSGVNPNLIQEISDRILKYYKEHIISKHAYLVRMSHNNMVQSIIYLEKWQRWKSLQHRKDSIRYHRSSYIMMRLWIILLLCLPLSRSKWILSKIIKRG